MSTSELDGINLAAAICKDAPETDVYLIANQTNGSELSRATSAGISGILTTLALGNRFAEISKVKAACESVARLDSDEMLSEITHDDLGPDDDPARSFDTNNKAKEQPVDRKDSTAIKKSEAACCAISDIKKEIEVSLKNTDRNGSAFVVSFLGGSGGVGKSTVATLCAYRAARMGYRTVALDCDMQFGDLHQLMGNVAALSIDDLLANPDEIEHLSMKTPDGMPALVKAPARLESSELLAAYVNEVIGICASEFDIIFVNTGASWNECHAQLLERSAVSVFLIDQRASSVHACRHALDLCMRLGIASASFVYALNKCKRGSLFSATDIANALQGAHVFEIRDGSTEVEEMLGAGMAQDLATSKNEICTSIDDMLADLLPVSPSSGFNFGQSFKQTERRRGRKKGSLDNNSQHSDARQKSRI